MDIVAHAEFLGAANALPKDIKSKLVKVLTYLANDSRHPGLQTRKIRAAARAVFECRVDQAYRLIYEIYEGRIQCVYVGTHDVALRYGENSKSSVTSQQSIEEIVLINDVSPVYLQYLDGLVDLEFKPLDPVTIMK